MALGLLIVLIIILFILSGSKLSVIIKRNYVNYLIRICCGAAVTDSNSGYGLDSGKYVKQAYINYVRNGESVIGGRQYTSTATSGTTAIHTSASCWDSIFIGSKYTTHFYYGWIYR